MANLFWISAAKVLKDLGPGPYTAAELLSEYGWTFARADAATCATYLDIEGQLRVAAANLLRRDYTPYWADGLTETDGRPKSGFLLQRSRINRCVWSDALSNWTNISSPVVTDAFVTLGDLGLTLLEDDNAAAVEGKRTAVALTGDGIKDVLFYVRAPATPSDANLSRFRLRDDTAAASRLDVSFTWNADGTLGSAAIVGGAGVVIQSKRLGLDSGGRYVYAVYCEATNVVAANSNFVEAFPGGVAVASDVGKMVIGGVDVADAACLPSGHRIKTTGAAVTRAGDSWSFTFTFGVMDWTMYHSMHRPIHADYVGTYPVATSAHCYRTSGTPSCRGVYASATRTITATVDTTGTDLTATQTLTVGATMRYCAQYRNLHTTGGLGKVDTGAGFGAEAGPASAFSAWGTQTFILCLATGELDGIFFEAKARAGLATLTEMETEPSFAPFNPHEVTDFDTPGPLISKAGSGRVNVRNTQQIGRTWTERYLLSEATTSHREFLARMRQYWANGTFFEKSHPDYLTPKGVGGGVPRVMGASQTGSTLIVDGCPLNTANWLRAGDIFRVEGLPQALECAADVHTEGSGRALIPLTRPIFTGGSPSDNAGLTITGVVLDVVLLEPPGWPTTSGRSVDYGELSLVFSEAL